VKLRELMTRDVRTCTPDTTITDVARTMAEINCGFVPVVDSGKVVGVITDRDIVLRAVAKGVNFSSTFVKDCMTKPAVTVSPDTDAHQAADLMADKQIRRLVVTEGDSVVGVVALGDMATVDIHVNEAGRALSDISEPARPGAH
jgi:CBS domain-containing protein